MRLPRSVGAVAALALLAACSLDTGPNVPAPIDPANDTYASSLNVDISKMTKTSSGLYYRDLQLGEGVPAMAGDSVQVDYTLWLTNGTKVQSTLDTGGTPFEFLLGGTPLRVIPGFDEGVTGMQPGGTRQLVIPSQLAWGSAGQSPIQPNANVVFQVTYIKKF
ncbi:MAG TPA: FKBP-type peptidyl-prolyl cis-trans isomerase [Gemmatimonadaceae bacterium]|nr:FKBP-type peptidyl-prolyl cis-trans isomerase [Gemmatimonadaceae bacterium]